MIKMLMSTKTVLIGTVACYLSTVPITSAFLAPSRDAVPLSTSPLHRNNNHIRGTSESLSALSMASGDVFETTVDLPGGKGLSAQMKFNSVLEVPSEVIEVRYKLPFGLDVEPKNNFAVCTKDGAGGEKVGDILRYTSQWTMGLPQGDGVVASAMAFSGGISWQCSLFDVMKAGRWQDVVDALVSNEPSRTDEVVLLFERPLPEKSE